MALEIGYRTTLLRDLVANEATRKLAIELLASHIANFPDSDAKRLFLETDFALPLIQAARWDEAIQLISGEQLQPEQLSEPDLFNLAMALWGKTGLLPRDLLKVLLAKEDTSKTKSDPNHEQCYALVNWGLGRRAEALQRLEKAISLAVAARTKVFSCWRYAEVSASDFTRDCEQLRRMIQGEAINPEFLPRPEG
jgi:hypothetical protein